jgi:hypothetical protein
VTPSSTGARPFLSITIEEEGIVSLNRMQVFKRELADIWSSVAGV